MDDDLLWLEDLDSDAAAKWVSERNRATIASLAADDDFRQLCGDVQQQLDSVDKIAYPKSRGDYLYNFWRDAQHTRGIWRRTTLAEYRQPEPSWEVLLDLDALASQESENWVWSDVSVLRPGYERALIGLSRGGSDAIVVREFDLASREFVSDGFGLPEAKSRFSWIDRDHIFVGTDFGPGSLTRSGYPRIAKKWQRGTPLTEAVTVFEGEEGDVGVSATHDPSPGFARSFVRRGVDFYRSESYLRADDGSLKRIPVPDDAQWQAWHEWLLIRLRSDWTVAGLTYAAGSLLAANFDDFAGAGPGALQVLFEPSSNTTLTTWACTEHHVITGLLVDVTSKLEILTPGPDRWDHQAMPGVPELSAAHIVDADKDNGDRYFLSSTGFLRPPTLDVGWVGRGLEPVKSEPAQFDTSGLTTRQFFATSADGTKVPYFVIGDPADGIRPVWLTGYGGFENSQTPYYDKVPGRHWLTKGGSLAVANIRGGGEYGPVWHRDAIREKRYRAFEDFAAVAQDLVERGLTEPARLGIEGWSNGGLLMGVMLTRYPHLFGAIIAGVPLLDMRRYHLLLAGASWMAEYGDPDNPDDWAFIKEYSPYHQLQDGVRYPPVLFITSTRDDRVHPAHARKMASRLLAQGQDVTYYENPQGGHGSASDNEQRAFVDSLALTFMRQRLGLAEG